MQLTESEVLWWFFQAVVLAISIIGLDWDARHGGFTAKTRIGMILVLIIVAILLGSLGVVAVILVYWVYSRHLRKG